MTTCILCDGPITHNQLRIRFVFATSKRQEEVNAHVCPNCTETNSTTLARVLELARMRDTDRR